ncbi:FadR/GntR family transcriptional regulator [Catenovulum sediminis]|uniref:FadR/GntR family transcriptional regulator n=1 Tax=Catenovulum sediminis TaxID=1740262 RepID=A0ABV1RC86_9ALTE|nr:FadR/GntR family transcriptional regulator [Catenovulum sediminis]
MLNVENESKRLYLQIAGKLAELVEQGEVAVGQRFPAERELAARYQVSRSTIREAMIALEVSKLVEIRSGSGIYALAPSKGLESLQLTDDLPGPFEIIETRQIIEVEAAGLAAERISNAELHQLKNLLLTMEEATKNGDVAKAEQIDHLFHLTIVKATRNNALIPMYEWLWSARETSAVNKQFHHKLRDKVADAVISEHKAMVDALMQRDAEKAKAVTQIHLKAVEKRLATSSFV